MTFEEEAQRLRRVLKRAEALTDSLRARLSKMMAEGPKREQVDHCQDK